MNRLLFGSAVLLVLSSAPTSAQQLPGGAAPLRPVAQLPGGGAPLEPASQLPGGAPGFAVQVPGTGPGIATQLPGAAPGVAGQFPGGAAPLPTVAQLPGGAPPLQTVAQLPGAAPGVAPQLPGVAPGIAAQLPGVGPGLAAPRGPVFGGFRSNAVFPIMNGRFGVARSGAFFPRAGFGNFLAFPYGSSFYSGFGGGFITGGYSPTFVVPFGGGYYDPYDLVAPAVLPPAPPTHVVELSGEAPARLTLEFPAAAVVWLDGKEVTGQPETVRTITSPVLRPGQEYTFHVRARWKADGKTYEYNRNVALGAGLRSKLLVVSGTAVTAGQ